ncbi:MAG: hypothetical protein SGPRY_001277 [Prymnesium sp.]
MPTPTPRPPAGDLCPSRSGVGVCVTGEARSFAFTAVRSSLKQFLAAIGAVIVRMHVARVASSSMGWTHAHDKLLRSESVRNISFSARASDLAREFSAWNASVRLVDTSSCGAREWRRDECCALATRGNASLTHRFPPGSYLQYATFGRCVRELLTESPCLALVVRTRPDSVYLNATLVAEMSLEPANRPALIRKGERGIYMTNPGDQYLVAQGHLAFDFFSSFDIPILAACQRAAVTGDSAWERLAWDPVPELTWLKRHSAKSFVLRSFPVVQGHAEKFIALMLSGISTRSVQADVWARDAQDYKTKAGMDMKTAKQL